MPKNIVETARDAGAFTTLIAAIDHAGLEPTLAGEGPVTVFAPSDARRSRNCPRERSSRRSPSPTS